MLKQDRDVHMFNYAHGNACTIRNLTFAFKYMNVYILLEHGLVGLRVRVLQKKIQVLNCCGLWWTVVDCYWGFHTSGAVAVRAQRAFGYIYKYTKNIYKYTKKHIYIYIACQKNYKFIAFSNITLHKCKTNYLCNNKKQCGSPNSFLKLIHLACSWGFAFFKCLLFPSAVCFPHLHPIWIRTTSWTRAVFRHVITGPTRETPMIT